MTITMPVLQCFACWQKSHIGWVLSTFISTMGVSVPCGAMLMAGVTNWPASVYARSHSQFGVDTFTLVVIEEYLRARVGKRRLSDGLRVKSPVRECP